MSNTFLELLAITSWPVLPPHLAEWLAQENISLLFSVNGKNMFALGRKTDGQIALDEYDCENAFALAAAQTQTIYLFTRFKFGGWKTPCLHTTPPMRVTTDCLCQNRLTRLGGWAFQTWRWMQTDR